MDRSAVDASIKDVQGLHSRLMQGTTRPHEHKTRALYGSASVTHSRAIFFFAAYEALLESYMYSTGAPSGKSAPSSRPPDASPGMALGASVIVLPFLDGISH